MPFEEVVRILLKYISDEGVVSVLLLAWMLKRYVINGTVDRYFAVQKRQEELFAGILEKVSNMEELRKKDVTN